jgi:protein SDA1
LLEKHIAKEREERGLDGEDMDVDDEEDADAGWEGWDAETDSDSESSDSWHDVSSDDGGDVFEVSDSEDEKSAAKGSKESNDDKAGDDVEDASLGATKTGPSVLTTTKVKTV